MAKTAFEKFGGNNKNTVTKEGRTIKTGWAPASNFDPVKGNDGNEYNIVNVNIPIFNGQVFESPEGEGYGHANLSCVIDLDKMGPNGPFTGAAGDAKKPVDIEFMVDNTKQENDPNHVMARLVIDPAALSSATYAVKCEKAAEANTGYKPSEDSKDRLSLKDNETTTKNGVAAMSPEGVGANVAKAASLLYMLTVSPKKDPSINLTSKDDVEAVAKLINDTYKSVAENIAKGVYENGVKSAKTGEVIPGTTLAKDSFSKVGLKVAEVDGATVIGMNGTLDAKQKEAMTNTMAVFNKIVTSTISQKVNDPENGYSNMAKKLGNMISLNAYAQNPRDPENPAQALNMTLIQPSVTANFEPYSSAILRGAEIMQRVPMVDKNGQEVVRTAADRYGPNSATIFKNATDLLPKSSGLNREEALAKQIDMLKSVEKAFAGGSSFAKAKAKAGKANEGKANEGKTGPDITD